MKRNEHRRIDSDAHSFMPVFYGLCLYCAINTTKASLSGTPHRGPFPGFAVDPGADCSLRSQGRPFFAFSTIHRMLEIPFGNRMRTPSSA